MERYKALHDYESDRKKLEEFETAIEAHPEEIKPLLKTEEAKKEAEQITNDNDKRNDEVNNEKLQKEVEAWRNRPKPTAGTAKKKNNRGMLSESDFNKIADKAIEDIQKKGQKKLTQEEKDDFARMEAEDLDALNNFSVEPSKEELIEFNAAQKEAAGKSGDKRTKEGKEKSGKLAREVEEAYNATLPAPLGERGISEENAPKLPNLPPATINDGVPEQIFYPGFDDKAPAEHPDVTWEIHDEGTVRDNWQPEKAYELTIPPLPIGKKETTFGSVGAPNLSNNISGPKTFNEDMVGSSWNRIPTTLAASGSNGNVGNLKKNFNPTVGRGNVPGTTPDDIQGNPGAKNIAPANNIAYNNVNNSSSGIMSRPVKKVGHLKYQPAEMGKFEPGKQEVPQLQTEDIENLRKQMLQGLEKRIYEHPEKWSDYNITEKYKHIGVDNVPLEKCNESVLKMLDSAF